MSLLARKPALSLEDFEDLTRTTARNLDRDVARRALFRVPVEKAVFGYGFRHGADSHPWTAALAAGPVRGLRGLRAFYQAYGPRSFSETWYPLPSSRGQPPGQFRIHPWPWTLGNQATLDNEFAPAEGRAGAVTGRLGPLSPDQVRYEWRRLRAVQFTVKLFGLRLDQDLIAGHFLASDQDWVFVVEEGQHRAAVLAACGQETIPARLARPEQGVTALNSVTNAFGCASALACLDPVGVEMRRELIRQCFSKS